MRRDADGVRGIPGHFTATTAAISRLTAAGVEAPFFRRTVLARQDGCPPPDSARSTPA